MEELIAKYLADEMGAEERSKFEEKLLLDEQLSDELQQSMAALEISSFDTISNSEFNTNAAWDKVANSIVIERSLSPEKTKFSFLKIVASILIIVSAGYFILRATNVIDFTGEVIELRASNSQVEEFELPDGSVIKLDPNSSLTYHQNFGEGNREVTLEGAAYFDVKRNEQLPFIIKAKNSQVEVLGTSFDVRAFKNEPVEVNVTSGKVGFRSTKAKGDAQVLSAGEKAILSIDGTKMLRTKVKNQNYAGWWTRKLVFENTKLSEVAKDLEKTYWVKIDVSEAIMNCPTTQIIENKTLNEVLEILEATFPSMTITTDKENHIKLDGIPCTD